MGRKLEDIETKKKRIAPGPGRYDPKNSVVNQSMPNCKFGSSSREELGGGKEQRNKPGPGQYYASNKILVQSSPSFGFGSSQRESLSPGKLKTPGPGNYPSKKFLGTEGVRYSMGATI